MIKYEMLSYVLRVQVGYKWIFLLTWTMGIVTEMKGSDVQKTQVLQNPILIVYVKEIALGYPVALEE